MFETSWKALQDSLNFSSTRVSCPENVAGCEELKQFCKNSDLPYPFSTDEPVEEMDLYEIESFDPYVLKYIGKGHPQYKIKR